ncbi:hypothetical protein ACFWWC_46080 [Streptomyces sp. NPDC058642]|uniref:hypothetical protein n=1 Tax=Streptomyces sp. NPDC058642 TaxID=3346572 RepID=UPI00364F4D79
MERACRKCCTLSAKDAPDAYVGRIMVNLANDRWRRFRRTVQSPVETTWPRRSTSMADRQQGPVGPCPSVTAHADADGGGAAVLPR